MVGRPRRGEVYWADLEPVVGSEQGGRRPVLVVQNEFGNIHARTTIIVPLTTRRPTRPYPFIVHVQHPALGPSSWAQAGQIRTIDKARLLPGPIAMLEADVMARIDEALRVSLGMH